jgi:hypothetical protein
MDVQTAATVHTQSIMRYEILTERNKIAMLVANRQEK